MSNRKQCPWCIPGIDNCYCKPEEIEAYHKHADQSESDYCKKCGACGEDGCCPPTMCKAVKCKYGETYIEDYERMRKQWDIMFNALGLLERQAQVDPIVKKAINDLNESW